MTNVALAKKVINSITKIIVNRLIVTVPQDISWLVKDAPMWESLPLETVRRFLMPMQIVIRLLL